MWFPITAAALFSMRQTIIAVRDLLNQMIRWHLFLREGRPVDMGILDCNMEKLLEEELFLLYKKTYPHADYEKICVKRMRI